MQLFISYSKVKQSFYLSVEYGPISKVLLLNDFGFWTLKTTQK